MTYFKVKGGTGMRQKPYSTKPVNQEKIGLLFGCNTAQNTTSANVDIVTIKKEPRRETRGKVNNGASGEIQTNERYL